MFILPTLIKNSKIYFLAKFQPDYVIFVYFIDQKVLVCKIHSAIRNNFKLSQLGDFTMPSQSWKLQFKRLTTAVFISWYVFWNLVQEDPAKMTS